MKRFIISLSSLAFLGLNTGTAIAKGGSSSSNSPPPPPVHHGSSAPAMAPIGGGLPHNHSAPFRPTTVYGGGQRTLVYPSVSNSTVHPSTTSNLNSVHNGALRGGGKLGSQSPTGVVTKTKLDPQAAARLRNWNGNVSGAAQARAIHLANCHHHHDHNWWKHHCVTLIFFDWGWWGWYDGWWYPAWGYDPYSNYEYNEPIYGQSGLAPDQIVAGVQAKLQQLGYYTYSIDGKMGPLTQSAIARYQRDHRMSITSGIDSATLGSLGIIH